LTAFYENWELVLFLGKVDQLGTDFLPFELNKSLKTVQFNNHLLCKENKTLLEYNETNPSSWWNNFYTYGLLLDSYLYESQNNKPNLLLIMGMLAVLLFVGFYSSHHELAYNYNVLLFNPALLALLYSTIKTNKKWIYNLCLFNLALVYFNYTNQQGIY
jgi:hypothetical protein